MNGNPNADLIQRFYGAFAKRDWAAMAACYHEGATFADPVFPDLDAGGVRAMWRMLCERGKDLELTLVDHAANGDAGTATWEARYTFQATGRKVLNRIAASFKFKDGLIIEHRDHFDFWRWSRQALGIPGVLLGWTPLLRKKVQRTARGQLERARAKAGS